MSAVLRRRTLLAPSAFDVEYLVVAGGGGGNEGGGGAGGLLTNTLSLDVVSGV